MSLISESGSASNRGSVDESTDFRFLPKALTAKCRQLVETYHHAHGDSNLAHVLWNEETRDFIELNADLHRVFRKASITRSAKKAKQCYLIVATIILSIEVLASGFAGWGRRFPAARRRADLLLGEFLPHSRTHLMDIYLYQKSGYANAIILETIAAA